MFAGEQDLAMGIFEDLHKETDAVRVKLEWARSAFLGKRYDLSKKLFDQILTESIPDVVRFNIALYLTEIAKLGDQTDYGWVFTRDTNPFAMAKAQQILIYGIPFTYTPPRAQETLFGLNFYVAHSRSLTDGGTVRLIAEADDTEYEGKDNNKSSIKLALQLKDKSEDNLSFKFGVDHFFQRRNLLLSSPYLGIQYRKDQLAGYFNQYQLEFKTGKNNYAGFPLMDGTLSSLTFYASKNLENGIQVGGNLHLDKATSITESQVYSTELAGVYARFFMPFISSNTRISFTKTRRTYKGLDELFIIKREDFRENISLSIQPYSIKIFGLYPVAEVGIEKSTSNIPINSFKRAFANFALRKNY